MKMGNFFPFLFNFIINILLHLEWQVFSTLPKGIYCFVLELLSNLGYFFFTHS